MKSEIPRPARLLGVFAHPDDEIFCAGGTFAKYARAGAVTMVVSATRGEAGQIRDAAAATRRTLGTVREAELRQAGVTLGVTYTRCLSYKDGGLQDVDPSVLSSELAVLISTFQPDAVVTFGADGAYGHPDHIAISHAVTAACRRATRANAGIQLFYSAFPRNQLLLGERLAQVVHTRTADAECSPALAHALALVAEDLAMMGCARDDVQVRWFSRWFVHRRTG
jgi:LmbE family N-acetylglucosaminyl deacetylase